MEDRWEILCETAKRKIPFHWIFSNIGGYNKNHGCGIKDILNYKFPETITLEEIREQMPEDLYTKILGYTSAYGKNSTSLALLIEETNFFRDNNGEISKDKIIEYFSDSNNGIDKESEADICNYLDVDDDRKGIISIIQARLGEYYRHFSETKNIRTTKDFKGAISYIKERETAPDMTTEEAIRKFMDFAEGDYMQIHQAEKENKYSTPIRLAFEEISDIYSGFKNSFQEKYGREVSEETIKSSFSICILAAYNKISKEAVKESEKLFEIMQGTETISRIGGGGRDGRDN